MALIYRVSHIWDNEDVDIVNNDLLTKLNEIEDVKDIYDAVNARNINENDCPVCFIALSEEPDMSKILACPTCQNAIHRKCARRWHRISMNIRCIICRSPVWTQFLTMTNSPYLNLS
jgi:hypothetical protein